MTFFGKNGNGASKNRNVAVSTIHGPGFLTTSSTKWTVLDNVGLIQFGPPFLVTAAIRKRSDMHLSACASLQCRLLPRLLQIVVCAEHPSVN